MMVFLKYLEYVSLLYLNCMIDIDQPFNLVVGYISSTLKVTLQFRKVKKLAAALLPLRGSVFLGARNIA